MNMIEAAEFAKKNPDAVFTENEGTDKWDAEALLEAFESGFISDGGSIPTSREVTAYKDYVELVLDNELIENALMKFGLEDIDDDTVVTALHSDPSAICVFDSDFNTYTKAYSVKASALLDWSDPDFPVVDVGQVAFFAEEWRPIY